MRRSKATKPLRVLVLDGETRSALAVVRSLGRAGYEIGVVSTRRSALAAHSKHCSVYFPAPDGRRDRTLFTAFVMDLARGWRPDYLIPLSDLTLELISAHRAELESFTCVPLPSPETIAAVNDKQRLLQLAAELGLNVPDSLLVPPFAERSQEDVRAIQHFRYPAVLKPRSTESPVGESYVKTPVHYPVNPDEALSLVSVSTLGSESRIAFLLQSRISGDGVGVFALLRGGEPLALFCHRRILEKPPSGGPSVLSESIPEDDAPVDDALKLLRQLRWDGVAMVEFKRDRNGTAYLMEINPRFWGSLQLAIDSGRDFPKLLIDAFEDSAPWTAERCAQFRAAIPPYTVGTRLRWGLGTLDHLLIRLRESPLRALADITLRNSLQLMRKPKQSRLEVMRFDDLGPFAYELRSYVRELFGGTAQ